MHLGRTLDLAIPRQVASPQSLTPLHQANALYHRQRPYWKPYPSPPNPSLTRGRLWVTPAHRADGVPWPLALTQFWKEPKTPGIAE